MAPVKIISISICELLIGVCELFLVDVRVVAVRFECQQLILVLVLRLR